MLHFQHSLRGSKGHKPQGTLETFFVCLKGHSANFRIENLRHG